MKELELVHVADQLYFWWFQTYAPGQSTVFFVPKNEDFPVVKVHMSRHSHRQVLTHRTGKTYCQWTDGNAGLNPITRMTSLMCRWDEEVYQWILDNYGESGFWCYNKEELPDLMVAQGRVEDAQRFCLQNRIEHSCLEQPLTFRVGE